MHFREDDEALMDLTAEVQLPKIGASRAKHSSLGGNSRHASVSKNKDESQQWATSMKYYTTYIRKVNEMKTNLHQNRRAKY